ncbi:YegP family protein, partial [Pseudomonas aeruginosa]
RGNSGAWQQHQFNGELVSGLVGASPYQYYFTLHANNGQVIGKSETYTTAQARDGGIAAVKAYGPIAPVVDLT